MTSVCAEDVMRMKDQRPRLTPKEGFVPVRLDDAISHYADEERLRLREWSQQVHKDGWQEEWLKRGK